MDKLKHSHDDYYEFRDEFYKIERVQNGTILLMNDDFDSCLICDKEMNILHEITISSVNNNTATLAYAYL
jgi:hypothetical protein